MQQLSFVAGANHLFRFKRYTPLHQLNSQGFMIGSELVQGFDFHNDLTEDPDEIRRPRLNEKTQ